MTFMKRLAVVALLAGLAAAGSAQGQAQFSMAVGGSYWQVLDKDVRDAMLDGGGLWGASLAPRLWFTPHVGVEFRGSWYMNFYDVDRPDEEWDVSLQAFSGELGLVLNYPLGETQFSVYGGAGGGYYYLSEDVDVKEYLDSRHRRSRTYTRDFDYDAFGGWGMGGIKLQLAEGFSLFGECRYVNVKPEEKDLKARYDCTGVQYIVGFVAGF